MTRLRYASETAAASAAVSVRAGSTGVAKPASGTACQQFGVNLSGGEFGAVPGTYGVDYIYPGIDDEY